MYVYIKSEPQLWTVGFYAPDGEWVSESDYECRDDAAERVRGMERAKIIMSKGAIQWHVHETLNQGFF